MHNEPYYDEAAEEIDAISSDAKVVPAATPGQINIILPEWAMDRVLEAAGDRLANNCRDAVTKVVAAKVAELCNEAFIAEVTRRAHESAVTYLDKPRTRTNEWGESLGGAAVTWSEAIPKAVEAYMNASVDKQGNTTSYSSDKKGTRLSWLLQTHVTDQLKTETEKAAKAVTEQARAIVAQHVGRFISEQMVPAIDVQKN